MPYETVGYEVSDHIATITLNRPERLNAFSRLLSGELIGALHRANDDGEVRAVIVTGAGRAFSAGLDLQERQLGQVPEPPDTEAGEAEQQDVHYVFEQIACH
jgi:enoyl-CoA hydratase/carnithine racemase